MGEEEMLLWGTSFLFHGHRAEGGVLTLQQEAGKERRAQLLPQQCRAEQSWGHRVLLPICPLATVHSPGSRALLCANGIPARRQTGFPPPCTQISLLYHQDGAH